MKKRIIALSFLVCAVLCWNINPGYAFKTDFHGHLQTNYILRDTNGFQNKFMDDVVCSQWLTELKFDVTVRPEDMSWGNIKLHKFFFTYRGAYDAVFDVTDRWDNVRDKSPDDWQLGKDDLKVENDLREAFVDLVSEFGEQQSIVVRLGRQIVQWGEADGFNVVNQVNPQDNSNKMFFEKPEDIATPLWMLRADYTTGMIGPFDSIDLQLVVIPDIRPHQYAPLTDDESGVDAYGHNNAPYAFGFKYVKDWGIPCLTEFAQNAGVGPAHGALMGLVPGFVDGVSVADGSYLLHYALPAIAGDPALLGGALAMGSLESKPFIALKEEGPDSHIDNLEYGGKIRFGYKGSELCFYYLRSYQDDPSIDLSRGFTEQALYFQHPKQHMYGFSLNTYVAPLNAVIRAEGNYINKMGIADMEGNNSDFSEKFYGTLPEDLIVHSSVSDATVSGATGGAFPTRDSYIQYVESLLGFDIGLDPYDHPRGYEMYNVSQWLVGFDKSVWLRWLNSHNMINTSFQAYWRHIHEFDNDPVMRPWDAENNYRLTGFFYTDFCSGKIHPELFVMYDTKDAWMTNLSIKFTKDGQWFFKWGIMAFWGDVPEGNGRIENQYSMNTTNPFMKPALLTDVSEMSFMVGYNW